ncbi:restriction endonuclease subunit S [Aurantimonas sp. DM33-3]|uniref:restriction endonuclease subunit S n=1 Tax=Aurantimonas sp. DM33-3 TaxID=2766955 RepID=UPI001651C7D4|nr:restriction endonuclease subunit S [Aurantimonas sp. DM33-3]MBC6718684.1 restriction endonuclease subunit S [Aurantimonas sp. DM33-3]
MDAIEVEPQRHLAADRARHLPDGWCWATLETVSPVNPATNFDDLPQDHDIPFIPMAAVSEETGVVDSSARRKVSDVAKGYVRFMEGDVIFAKITPCMENGKVAPVSGFGSDYAAGSTEFHVLRPVAVEQRYLWYWLVSRGFRAVAKRNMSGSAGQLRVPVSYLRASAIPLPPRAEQRRIIERIDALFAEIAEGEAALEEARQGLEIFRRSLLKAAVTGELTRDWRETNMPPETGHDLLERIRAERQARPSTKRRKQDLTPIKETGLAKLPSSWARARLGDLFDVNTGSTPSRSKPELWDGDVPWVSSGEVAFCRISSTREKISRSSIGKNISRINPIGTVLLAMIGEGKTRGQCAILDIEAANNQNVAAIKVSKTEIPPDFIYTSLQQRYFSSRRESQGGNQPALNASKVASMTIALPPLEEIQEINSILSGMLSEIAESEMVITAELSRSIKLRSSISKAAFEGKLVPQDSTDEPAAILLERLARERQQPSKSRRGRKPKSGAKRKA